MLNDFFVLVFEKIGGEIWCGFGVVIGGGVGGDE